MSRAFFGRRASLYNAGGGRSHLRRSGIPSGRLHKAGGDVTLRKKASGDRRGTPSFFTFKRRGKQPRKTSSLWRAGNCHFVKVMVY